ncbi:acetylxylan esterase [Pseudonocardia kunmingensis]|uniref:Cephalosporin-C deacetylase n=1 Tax=Pseudonocardia kunmingensis TaxID=630975 RepID=A0A543D1D4_9PSEU|nr:acetylxylan esterase [Pseudonocardia kunmingensis]TQM03008.1 cephalosporin-C deacetylase [Pseudonocardia kunmingensis]
MALFDLPLDRLETYRPEVREPADLDASWAATLADARRADPVADVRPVENGLVLVDTWDVTFRGFGAHPVRAWFSRPAHAGDADLPAVVEYLGYGRGRGLPHERLTWAAAGYAHLLMDTRGQGGQYGTGGDTDDPVGAGPAAPGFLTRGIREPAQHYYRRLVTDAVRAVDAVRELPGVDPRRVAVAGNSQGGGLALAAAGLVGDLTAVLASVPFLCHPGRALEITDAHPWQEVVQYLSVHRGAQDAVLHTLSYVDGVNFARRATAPALFAVGLRDTVCPPSTVFAAYNHYAGSPKEIAVHPFNGHEGGDAVHVRRQLEWLAATMPSKTPSRAPAASTV